MLGDSNSNSASTTSWFRVSRGVFGTLPNINDGFFLTKMIFNYFCWKLHHRCFTYDTRNHAVQNGFFYFLTQNFCPNFRGTRLLIFCQKNIPEVLQNWSYKWWVFLAKGLCYRFVSNKGSSIWYVRKIFWKINIC